MSVECQKRIPVYYDGVVVGDSSRTSSWWPRGRENWRIGGAGANTVKLVNYLVAMG